MPQADREACDRIYRNSIGDIARFEQALVRATIETYIDADEVSNLLYVPEEVRFSGPDVRRGMFEKRMAKEIAEFGGLRIPMFTARKSDGCQTSHYSSYRLQKIDFTISAVQDETAVPRFASFRQDRFERVQTALGFIETALPSPNAQLNMLFKHGKDEIDSAIPQFGLLEVLDGDLVSIWKRNLFQEQQALVEQLLDVRAEAVPGDEGIVRLRARLRRANLDNG